MPGAPGHMCTWARPCCLLCSLTSPPRLPCQGRVPSGTSLGRGWRGEVTDSDGALAGLASWRCKVTLPTALGQGDDGTEQGKGGSERVSGSPLSHS